MADCEEDVPSHKIHPSAGSNASPEYMVASGALVPNEGGVHIQHRGSDGAMRERTFQHAEVH